MRRYGQVLGIKPEHLAEYTRLHAAVWPAVLEMIAACHMHNYSIFVHADTLFAYFEYDGDDFEADYARMAADPQTQAWWAINMPLQQPLPTRQPGEWWADMREIFHTE